MTGPQIMGYPASEWSNLLLVGKVLGVLYITEEVPVLSKPF